MFLKNRPLELHEIFDFSSYFSWLFQLAHTDDEDAFVPEEMLGQQLKDKAALSVAGGGQHTVLLAK